MGTVMNRVPSYIPLVQAYSPTNIRQAEKSLATREMVKEPSEMEKNLRGESFCQMILVIGV